jgi:xylem cysteine proteinase
MALSSLSLMFLLAFSFMSFFANSGLARDFSIVGYTPEDLTSGDKIIDLFESWISKHGKIYESMEEKWLRFEIFKDNLFHIDETNK